jgi:hypothetical protein
MSISTFSSVMHQKEKIRVCIPVERFYRGVSSLSSTKEGLDIRDSKAPRNIRLSQAIKIEKKRKGSIGRGRRKSGRVNNPTYKHIHIKETVL